MFGAVERSGGHEVKGCKEESEVVQVQRKENKFNIRNKSQPAVETQLLLLLKL